MKQTCGVSANIEKGELMKMMMMKKMTHCGLGFDHVLWTLAAAAELHGTSSLLVEDDTEEEDKGALEGGSGGGGRRRGEGGGHLNQSWQPLQGCCDGQQEVSWRSAGGQTCRQLKAANR